MRRALPLLPLGVLLLTLTPCDAAADPFTASNTLTIDFASPGYPPTVNTLFLDIGLLQVLQPVNGFTASLYDGGRLLGTNSLHLFDNFVGPLHLGISNIWTAPGAPRLHPSLPQTTVDFDSILSGTIDGRIAFTIGAGLIDFTPSNVKLHASQTLLDGTGRPAISPTIQDVEVSPVPEPGTLVLALAGAAVAGVRRVRARSRAMPIE